MTISRGAQVIRWAIEDGVKAATSLYRAAGTKAAQDEDWGQRARNTSARVEPSERAQYEEVYEMAARQVVAGLGNLN